MSLESGGRTDKIGNQYENRYLAKLLLRLVEETICSIEVEPLGPDGDGVEYITQKSTGEKVFYQCKASNNIKTHWTGTNLNNLKVFEKAKKHIGTNPNNEYHFVSPLPYKEIASLCDRARMNHSAEDFLKHQLTNQSLRDIFADCEQYFGLSREKPEELKQLVFLLAHCYFELVPFNEDSNIDMDSMVGHCFVGNASAARQLLENCVNTNKWFGIELTSLQIIEYMEDNGFSIRNYGLDERIAPKIQTINETFWGRFSPINGCLIQRKATTEIVQYIKEGYSIILHGRAGAGKSGCIEDVVKKLEDEQILYLRIKLDKYIPKTIADDYGKSLGLPESPVYCLQKISAGKPCVLILDQLDSLRWTASHSAAALAVCEEMIRQAFEINHSNSGNVSILFVTRTFDYKNDSGIKGLFIDGNRATEWKSVELDIFSKEETKENVGEDYDTLSPRLQCLLRTPSTLYIWSQLHKEERCKSITSVDKMMQQWWQQILQKIDTIGMPFDSVDSFVTEVADTMNKRGVFSLSKRNYISKNKIIEALVSNGLLTENGERISFTHQSFLDYFLATESIKQIISGETLVELVGDKNEQTPNLRYRLLSILRGLLEDDEVIFLEQSRIFLESENVRYYYKCAVFEAIAQYDEPSTNILEFTKEYFHQNVWHNFILQVVYYGSSTFIENLNCESPFWMTEEGLSLLRSINCKNPDFVVRTLEPHCFNNPDDNYKILNCLCSDLADDSDEMYALKMKLLHEQPSLIPSCWHMFYRSFKTSPERCIDCLQLLLLNHENEWKRIIHFPENEVMKKFSKSNAEKIITILFPLLCTVTDGLASNIEKIKYDNSYEKWVNNRYNDGYLHQIVNIVKWSMNELCNSKPNKFLQLINKSDPSSALIGNEIVLSAIYNLPITYADDAISWMIQDFPSHIFDYTGKTSDFLDATKRILNRFSPHCTLDLFQRIEELIVSWNDSVEKMLDIYKFRYSTNKSKEYGTVYYAYWGHLQKSLLPTLCFERLTKNSKNLIRVLERNPWIRDKNYKSHTEIGAAKSVISPIDSYADKLSNKTWLSIIRTPEEKMKNHWGKETDSAYIEATPFTFASALGTVAETDPNRFASLSLQFPNDCCVGYISAILRALRIDDEDSCAELPLTCEVIRKFSSIENESIKQLIAEIVEKRSKENWPQDILETIKNIAIEPQEIKQKDKETPVARDLMDIMFNTPRGTAILAISKLLWNHKDLSDYFKDIVAKLSDDADDSARFATVYCAATYYNSDPTFATELFRKLLSKDTRILVAPYAWDILIHDYDNHRDFYREKLIQACDSEIKDLTEHSATYLCAIAAFRSDDDLISYILEHQHKENVVRKIIHQAASTFNDLKYHTVSQKILLKMIEANDVEATVFSTDYLKENINIERDHDFLFRIFQTKTGIREVIPFLKYLNESDINITCFADIIQLISSQVSKISEDYRQRMAIELLIPSVLQLFDKGKEDLTITTICLDIWDKLFQDNLSYIKPLGDMIDHFD